jgi:hypothetical protein
MVFGLRKKVDPFETCMSPTDSRRPHVWSSHSCDGPVNKDRCPAGFGILGENVKFPSTSPGYCALNWSEKWRAKCYYNKYKSSANINFNCCAGIKKNISHICPPGICKNSQKCKSVMRERCRNNATNPGYDKACMPFLNTYPDVADEIMPMKCATDASMKNNPLCQSYCKNNPGKCPQVPGFCERNPTNPLCSCINSALNSVKGGTAAPPSCFDNKCKTTGYQTLAMANVAKRGCTYIDCSSIVNASDNSVIKNVAVSQQCSAEISRKTERDRLTQDTPASERTPQQHKEISDAAKSNETAMLETAARDMAMYKVAGSAWVNFYVKNHIKVNNFANDWNMPVASRINLTGIPEPYYEKIKDITTGPSILILLFIILIVIAITWKLLSKKKMKKGGSIPLYPQQYPQQYPQPANMPMNNLAYNLPKIGTY